MANGLGTLLLVCVAAIVARPNEVPGFARNAGRVLGLSLRAVKRARDLADEAIKKSAASNKNNATVTAVTTSLRSTMSHFSALATSVQRDMSDIPLTPGSFIRTRLHRMAANHVSGNDSKREGQGEGEIPQIVIHPKLDGKQQQQLIQQQQRSADQTQIETPSTFTTGTSTSDQPSAMHPERLSVYSTVASNISTNQNTKTASDFIAIGIEEDALSRQQNKLLGRPAHDSTPSSPSSTGE